MTSTTTGVTNIRDAGAVGDGRAIDTAAVQRAIDATSAAGGGVVLCPPGTYRIGSILLKDNVELHLRHGATLLASDDRAHYSAAHNAPLDAGFTHERVAAEHLIYARNARNIAITGSGVIDGNGRAFLSDPLPGHAFYDVPGWRPGQLITFHQCSDVLIRDVRILDSPYWTIWPHGCQRVRIAGITIRNDRRTPNGDGINPDCCSNVVISDCHIDVGDDAIAVRSDGCRLGDPHRPCENITVTNCTFITPCCGVRIGYCGDGPIRNCTFSNIVMSNSRTGINMLVARPRKPEDGFVFEHGPLIHGIAFSNLVMDTRIAMYLWVGDDARDPAGIRDVTVSNVLASTERACYIGGSAAIPIERVRVTDMTLHVRGSIDPGDTFGRQVPYPYPVFDYWDRSGIPHGFYCRHVRDLDFARLRVEWGDIRGPWRSAMRFEHAVNVRLDAVHARPAPSSLSTAIHMTAVRGCAIRNCDAPADVSEFVRVDGDSDPVVIQP